MQANTVQAGVDPEIITQKPGLVSGTPVFPGTRVPVRYLLDYIIIGKSLDYFLDQHPTVTKEKAVKVLELAFDRTIGPRDEDDII